MTPGKYQRNFDIDANSGVVSVLTALDREEMDSGVITLVIKVLKILT